VPFELAELLGQCTVAVSAGSRLGSGFFVAPGMIVTCAHVVKAAVGEVEVVWNGMPFSASTVIDETLRKYDLALLRIRDGQTIEHPVAYLGAPRQIGDQAYAFGYSDLRRKG